jgi:hypothetical protein
MVFVAVTEEVDEARRIVFRHEGGNLVFGFLLLPVARKELRESLDLRVYRLVKEAGPIDVDALVEAHADL